VSASGPSRHIALPHELGCYRSKADVVTSHMRPGFIGTRPNELLISVSYSQLAVFDHSLERPFNEWTDRHVAQGFSWRLGSVAFRTIEEGGKHLVTVRLEAQESDPAPDAIRVIDVPFEIPPSGTIEIGSISDSVSLELPSDVYQLRFECYERANSATPRLRLLFYSNSKPHFEVVRADSELNPGRDLLLMASAV
jgi:Competence protein J (ComJ)